MSSLYRKPGLFRISLESQTPKYSDDTAVAVEQREHQHAFEVALERYEAVREACASLEAIHTTLSQECDTGLSAQSAYYMTLAVDRLSAVGGFGQAATPAMESFQGHNARSSTVLSMEGVSERLKQMLELLTKLWKELVAAAQRAWKSALMGLSAMRSQARKLAEEAREEKIRTGPIEIHYAEELSINGKVPPGIEGLKTTLHVVEEFHNLGLENNAADHMLVDVIGKLRGVKTDAEFEKIAADLSRFKVAVPRCFKQNPSQVDGRAAYETEVFSGERTYVMLERFDRNKTDDLSMRVDSYLFASWRNQSRAAKSPLKIQPLTADEISSIEAAVTQLETLCKKANDSKFEGVGAFDHDLEEMIRNGAYDQLSAKNTDKFVNLLHQSSRHMKNRMNMRMSVVSTALGVTRTYLRLADASIQKATAQAA